MRDLERAVDRHGAFTEQPFELDRLANEFRSFPVEELSGDVAAAFHKCRLAFLNLVVTLGKWSTHEGILPPWPRINMLRRIFIFQHEFEEAGGIFERPNKGRRKPSKSEVKISATVQARKEKFNNQWEEFRSMREQVAEMPDSAPAVGSGPS